MNNQDSHVVELKGVTKRFENITAVDGASISVNRREIFSLLGPSGCGKTTTLRLIAGLETPDDGKILINGKVVNNVPPYERPSNTIFQRLALFPHMTVEENLAFGLKLKRVPKEELKQRIREILKVVGLEGYERRRPNQLSGGQQQRIALARSLVLEPEVLLLDEPLSSLDRKLRKEMQVELKRIQRNVGTTFVYVTHDQKVALAISDRIAIMVDGKIVEIDTPTNIYERPKTKFAGRFVGASNTFTGKVVSKKNAMIQVETESGLKISALGDKKISVGENVEIVVRPERLTVLPENVSDETDNRVIGEIEEVTYQGEFTELEITLTSGDKMAVRLANKAGRLGENGTPRKGDRVAVSWARNDCIVLLD